MRAALASPHSRAVASARSLPACRIPALIGIDKADASACMSRAEGGPGARTTGAPPAAPRGARYNNVGPAGAAAVAEGVGRLVGLEDLDLRCAGEKQGFGVLERLGSLET